MRMCFRWFGDGDPVSLEYIRQVPGVSGIVSAVYDVPPGKAWTAGMVAALRERVEARGLTLDVIESVPVHEDIKLGAPGRDAAIEAFAESLRAVGEAGVPVVCYNFMPVFDWLRSDLAKKRPDGSTALSYDEETVLSMDPSVGELSLPGWDSSYTKDGLRSLLAAYREVDAERLWDNLGYFLERVVPVAESAGVRLAIHPDDPPWPVFGLPRIVTGRESLRRLTGLVDSPSNGITLCTGSLGADPANDLPAIASEFCKAGRLHFVHCRNVRHTGYRSFEESAHLSRDGSLDMVAVLAALSEAGYDGPARPDHGRMIWGETGRPGYGLYDRALGVAYVNGIWDALKAAK